MSRSAGAKGRGYHTDSRAFIAAYNYARRLKTLRGLTPYEFICKIWATSPNGSRQTRTNNCRAQI